LAALETVDLLAIETNECPKGSVSQVAASTIFLIRSRSKIEGSASVLQSACRVGRACREVHFGTTGEKDYGIVDLEIYFGRAAANRWCRDSGLGLLRLEHRTGYLDRREANVVIRSKVSDCTALRDSFLRGTRAQVEPFS